MRPRASLAAALAMCGALAGCGEAAGSPAGALDVPPPTATAASSPAASPAASPEAARVRPLGRPGAWRITTYYTAVESLHGGKRKAVKGCARFHCSHGRTPLGSYPAEFLAIVQEEGSGRITSGPQRGRYLNWSHSVGYWLDDTTRDSAGRPLRPWSSAAADKSVLGRGQRFAIVECGRDGNGHRIEAKVCAAFRKARWTVTDLFRPGYGGQNHADVYIGEETGTPFADSPFYTTLSGATLGPS
ncbi:hypothetical protein [Actinomadura opuntiae]|uniref:hypothetical protein n=1 Tax=Actinomadura sp. OS1-43 TaxID=604315 RepID=UPI00255B2370|nr:hypothetical protein [Actinomadura sp. OS1-43]MDL4820315.1 hypothetical protein [Actinomadura sp. OS1-43]